MTKTFLQACNQMDRRFVLSLMRFIIGCLIAWTLILPSYAQKKKPAKAASDYPGPHFVYDTAEQNIQPEMFDNPFFYEPGTCATSEGIWMTWLEFLPGKGDAIWVGLRNNNGWQHKKMVGRVGAFARPTLTVCAKGKLWLTYEEGTDGEWNIFLLEHLGKGEFGRPSRMSPGQGSDINHVVAPDGEGGLWIVWQSDRGGQFEIVARNSRANSEVLTVSNNPLGDWQPGATVSKNGALVIAWDFYDGQSYNVAVRRLQGGKWSKETVVAGSPHFEARSSIVCDQNGRLLVAWEEDGPNWGKHYTARTPGDKQSTRLGDSVGPVHRYRTLHIVELDDNTLLPGKTFQLPQPSLDLAAKRDQRPTDVKFTGAFYERGQLLVDGSNRPWIVYRHYYAPWLGLEPIHHVESDFAIYARCKVDDGWSKLLKFQIGQGDGTQRLSLSPTKNGFTAAWTTGRTDRKDFSKRPRGIAFATVDLPADAMAIKSAPQPAGAVTTPPKAEARPARPSTKDRGKEMTLFFGDLHRHTDLSLCYTPSDGTVEDAYRYAIDAAPLDFLGVTDHTHDLEMGEPLSHIWWRALKETDRHKLQNTFITYYSYERSRGDTDHNVISLRRDMMRPHTYPLPQFWQELDSDTISIPHEPFNPVLWSQKDDVHRPLMEIYQGYRHMSAEDAAADGLAKGHHVGFIASSDHLSTSASFAAVWAEKPDRESIFRAMQSRRTYGATAKIILKVTCAGHWMGEKFETKEMEPIRIEATPTAAVQKLDLYLDGKIVDTITNFPSSDTFVHDWVPAKTLVGPHIFHVRLTQSDGHRAWSSPLWADIKQN